MPSLVRRSVFILSALLLGGLCSTQGGCGTAPAAAPAVAERDTHGARTEGMPDAAREIVSRTNALRRQKGLGAVESIPALSATARDFATFMARSDQYGHQADGSRPGDRAKRHGYDFCILSENIAYQTRPGGFTSTLIAQSTVEGWRTSPEHRRNMLDPDVTQTGVAVAQSGRSGRIYAVQIFGRPKSESYRLQVKNDSKVGIEYALGDKRYPLRPGYTQTHRGCRPAPLRLVDPKEGRTVHPNDGDRFEVVETRGGVRLVRQP